MTHRFPIKEIARQAGLGTATVDRALNGRPHVSPQTRNRVAAALRELEAQESLLAARGRRLFVDIVAEAPRRFTREIRLAAEAALAQVAGAVIRLRFHFHEVMTEEEVLALLGRIRRRGSQGVCVKVRDTPAVRAAVDGLAAAGIPVFTLVTDLPGTRRAAYVGLDNANAGRTAAYLLSQVADRERTGLLTVRSQDDFVGETERYEAFRTEMARLFPACRITDVSGGAGLPGQTARRVSEALRGMGRLAGVYSIGGGNAAILEALAASGNAGVPFVAHDLDRENVALLRQHAISFVLHHELTDDMRSLHAGIMGANGLAASSLPSISSDVRIVAPYNIPNGVTTIR
jgi:LacI family transcriptional regulator